MSEKVVPRSTPPDKSTCPMHPEVRSEKPGSCPTCGMALEPVDSASTADRTVVISLLNRLCYDFSTNQQFLPLPRIAWIREERRQ